jgi:hypothetical protein
VAQLNDTEYLISKGSCVQVLLDFRTESLASVQMASSCLRRMLLEERQSVLAFRASAMRLCTFQVSSYVL